ncbi:MAG TPA: ABC transporter ATP-binding protein, partial [Thermoanaerobacterales bacterium]|nr:ABC transporter ATP-binding protein [Thermoanaerobacterales bacterium]
MNAILQVDNLHCRYASYDVLSKINLEIKKGDFVGVLGPNGSGKSTLLKTITRFIKPVKGVVLVDNIDISKFSDKEYAKKIGFVPQNYHFNYDFTVRDIVLMGRNPHLDLLEKEGSKDYEVTEKVMELTYTTKLKNKRITQLSGGEAQRVLIARALAQEPEILILDEPISHLDVNYKFEILELLRTLNMKEEMTIIVALHDINLAFDYSQKVILLKEGSIFTAGKPEEVLNTENLKTVFDVNVDINEHPITNKPFITFMPTKTKINNKKLARNRNTKIHIIGGGGQASFLMRSLHKHGYTITAGVLNIGDSDWKTAKQLNIDIAEEAPFAPISEKQYIRNLEIMQDSDYIILEDIPVGHGNKS